MRYQGLLFATTILLAWALWTLICLFGAAPSMAPLWATAVAVLFSTLLYTGLFITAHDAMHGTVAPFSRRLNNVYGVIAVVCYAIFSFQRLLDEHGRHHAAPGTDDDPDFYGSADVGFSGWYLRFLAHYITWRQVLLNAIAFNVLIHVFQVATLNALLFYVLPAFLSTLQLFYFGTYLPHRRQATSFVDRHNARSSHFSRLGSLLSCFHFGYHLEHHRSPSVPWWNLAERAHRVE